MGASPSAALRGFDHRRQQELKLPKGDRLAEALSRFGSSRHSHDG